VDGVYGNCVLTLVVYIMFQKVLKILGAKCSVVWVWKVVKILWTMIVTVRTTAGWNMDF